jgi:hypothetical protein
MTGDQPFTFRIAAPASDDNGSTEQCYHIIAGYAPATAHTNAGECEEYYDELDEHIAKKRQNDILIIATGCNAGVGNRRSWAKHKPASQMCLGNHGNGRKNTRGERFLDFCLEHSLAIASTCFEKKYYNTWTSTLGNARGYQLDRFCVQRCAIRRAIARLRTHADADLRSATPTTLVSSWPSLLTGKLKQHTRPQRS